MNRRLLAALAFAAAFAAFGQQHGAAQQGQLQLPGFKPPPPAPIKPYQAVAVTPPTALNDPSLTRSAISSARSSPTRIAPRSPRWS